MLFQELCVYNDFLSVYMPGHWGFMKQNPKRDDESQHVDLVGNHPFHSIVCSQAWIHRKSWSEVMNWDFLGYNFTALTFCKAGRGGNCDRPHPVHHFSNSAPISGIFSLATSYLRRTCPIYSGVRASYRLTAWRLQPYYMEQHHIGAQHTTDSHHVLPTPPACWVPSHPKETAPAPTTCISFLTRLQGVT